jgi:hypothetical protein
MTLHTLRSLGFDHSAHIPFTRRYTVRCSQCQALVINGTPTHETGCPHAVHECKGCNNLIPVRQKYCEDCQ